MNRANLLTAWRDGRTIKITSVTAE